MARRKGKSKQSFLVRAGKMVFLGIVRGLWLVVSLLGKGIALLFMFLAGRVKAQRQVLVRPRVRASFEPLGLESEVKGDFSSFQHRLLKDSMVVTIAGRRGAGKSALGFRLLENMHAKAKRKCFALGVRTSVLPSWIKSVSSLEEVSDDGVLLVDEGAVSFSSRSSQSKGNKRLSEMMAIARHKNISLIVVTQNTGMIDKNILSLTDALLFKKGSLLQSRMERSGVRKLYEKADRAFAGSSREDLLAKCYIFDADFEGLVSASLPGFWSDRLSKNKK